MINTYIRELVDYSIDNGLADELDRVYLTNRLAELFEIDEYTDPETKSSARDLHFILEDMIAWALDHGLLDSDSTASKDLFDTKIMGMVTPPPSVVISMFNELMREDPKLATDWYYAFSRATNYIRTDRIAKDVKWLAPTEYGPRKIRAISQRRERPSPPHIRSASSVRRMRDTPGP